MPVLLLLLLQLPRCLQNLLLGGYFISASLCYILKVMQFISLGETTRAHAEARLAQPAELSRGLGTAQE